MWRYWNVKSMSCQSDKGNIVQIIEHWDVRCSNAESYAVIQ